MLALFSLRLALGLLAALLVLPTSVIHPRFYRTHFLTVLGLCCVAVVPILNGGFNLPHALLVAGAGAFLGAIIWSIEGAPGGRLFIVLTIVALSFEILLHSAYSWRNSLPTEHRPSFAEFIADDLTAAALMGFALTAMLLGHSYLINPSMTLVPLKRLIIALGLALLARAILAGLSLALWTSGSARLSLMDVAWMWLPLRWLLGLIVPGVLTFMAWRTTKLRNTQSSTGILYVVVVFICIGELTAQLLLNVTGYFL